MSAKKVGLQIYSIRDIYLKNPREAFQLIKDCGYDAVDLFGNIIMSAGELRQMLDEVGLECCGWHVPWNYCKKDVLEAFAEYNRVIGNKYLIIPGLPGEYMESNEKWLEACAKIDEISKQLDKHGMFTGMHSHSGEFKKFDGCDEYPWDTLAKNTRKEVVLQLDMGNTLETGVNPYEILTKYEGRNQTIHMKPYSKEKGMNAYIGEDDINWADIVKFCNEKGNTEYFIIEFEEADAKEGIKICLDNFKKFL